MKNKIAIFYVLFLALPLLLGSFQVKEQSEKAKIYGFLFDDSSQSGYNPVALASISVLVQDACSLKCSSSDDGTFEIRDVTPGTYSLEIAEINHEIIRVDDIKIKDGECVSLRLRVPKKQGMRAIR